MTTKIKFEPSIYSAMRDRVSQIKDVNVDEFVNIAVQNLVNMSKKGLPEASRIMEFNWENK